MKRSFTSVMIGVEPDLDEEQVEATFDQLNLVLSEKMFSVSAAAMQDMFAAMVCYVSDSPLEARKLMKAIHKDILTTIDKNYSHYHADRLDAPRGNA